MSNPFENLNQELQTFVGKTITKVTTQKESIGFSTEDLLYFTLSRTDPSREAIAYLDTIGQLEKLVDHLVLSVDVFETTYFDEAAGDSYSGIACSFRTRKGTVSFRWTSDDNLPWEKHLRFMNSISTHIDRAYTTKSYAFYMIYNQENPYLVFSQGSDLVVINRFNSFVEEPVVYDHLQKVVKQEKLKSVFLSRKEQTIVSMFFVNFVKAVHLSGKPHPLSNALEEIFHSVLHPSS